MDVSKKLNDKEREKREIEDLKHLEESIQVPFLAAYSSSVIL